MMKTLTMRTITAVPVSFEMAGPMYFNGAVNQREGDFSCNHLPVMIMMTWMMMTMMMMMMTTKG